MIISLTLWLIYLSLIYLFLLICYLDLRKKCILIGIETMLFILHISKLFKLLEEKIVIMLLVVIFKLLQFGKSYKIYFNFEIYFE